MCVFVTWDMSLGCLLYLRCHQWEEDSDLVFLHTLLPGRARAREGKEHTTELSLVIREQNEYISGETQTARQSQLSSHQQLSSGMFAVIIQVE